MTQRRLTGPGVVASVTGSEDEIQTAMRLAATARSALMASTCEQ